MEENMKIVYASRTGNVESLIGKLGCTDTLQITTGNESIAEEYILFTYTDGYGDVPSEGDGFLATNGALLKGVISSGDCSYGEAVCLAGDKFSSDDNVPYLYKVENDGSTCDVSAITAILAKF